MIGKQFNLTADCLPVPTCGLNHNPPIATFESSIPRSTTCLCRSLPTRKMFALPVQELTDYERSIECADVNAYVAPSCGGGAPNATWDNSVNPVGLNGPSASGAECLTHASSAGANRGQDLLDPSPWPTNPMKITSQSGPQNGNFVTTSNSVVTIPIIDPSSVPRIWWPSHGGGFHAGVHQPWSTTEALGTTAGDINVIVMNIAGCSATANSANPVVGGAGTSPIPVRLISP